MNIEELVSRFYIGSTSENDEDAWAFFVKDLSNKRRELYVARSREDENYHLLGIKKKFPRVSSPKPLKEKQELDRYFMQDDLGIIQYERNTACISELEKGDSILLVDEEGEKIEEFYFDF